MNRRFRFSKGWAYEIFFVPTVGLIRCYSGNYKYAIAFAWLGWLFSVGFCKRFKEEGEDG